MAQRVQILLEDDLDHSEAAETVTFALDGVNYEIDLSTENASKLRDDLATWTGHARKLRGTRRTAPARTSGAAAGREDLNKMREWGRGNGFKVSDRGRVSGELQEAYARANS